MQIDWLTVGAQIVNFLVLVYLLKRFLYGPIVNAMDTREKRVTERLRQAQEREEAAQQHEKDFEHKTDELEARRKELIDEARQEAEEHRKELIADARGEAEELHRRWMDEVERERESFVHDLRRQVASWIARIARRALRDLADVELEKRVVGVFCDRIRKLDESDRDRLLEGIQDADEPLSIVTTFELSEEQRGDLRDAIEEATAEHVELRFAESADLVCGIELRMEGSALSWSIDGFVNQLAEDVDEGLRKAARSSGQALEDPISEVEEDQPGRHASAAQQETE